MELVLQFVLLFLVIIHSAGARLLDDDSSQKTALIEEKLISGQSPGVGHMSVQHQVMLSSGQSPGVVHMSVQHQVTLSSGQSPGVGHMSVQHSHAEEVMSMGVGHVGTQDTQIEEILPAGDSPGVGHMSIHNAHVKGMHFSGQSPGVGHMGAQDAHIDGILSSGQSLAEIDSGIKFSTTNKLPSGPSPGVGHMVINSQKSRDKHPAESDILAGNLSAETEQGATEKLNKIPCAENSCELGHVVGSRTEEKTTKSADHVDQESVTLNEVLPGKSHSNEQAAQVGSMETSLSAGERPEKGHSLGEVSPREQNDGGIIGCPESGTGSINLFDESTYYGAPTSLLFRVER